MMRSPMRGEPRPRGGRGRRRARFVVVPVAAAVVVGLGAPARAVPLGEGWTDRGPTYPDRLSMVFSGDVLIHEGVWEEAAAYAGAGARFDFRPMYASVRPFVSSADVAICHLETPLSPADRNLSSYPIFNVPHEIVDAVAWAGYDGCSTASNHSIDRGLDGVRATIDALEDAGLGHAGTASTRRASRAIAMYRVGRARVAHLSYSFSFNGLVPAHRWEANRLAVSSVLADARRARRAGADLTVVSLHWGAEYHHAPTPQQRAIADRLTGSGLVDLIVGHHAHVVQPIGASHGRPVVYGMGNQLSGQRGEYLGTRSVEDGVLVWAVARRVDGDYRVTKVLATPTWVAPDTYRILPTASTARDPATPAWLEREVRASFRRTMDEVLALGGRPFGLRAARTPPLGAQS